MYLLIVVCLLPVIPCKVMSVLSEFCHAVRLSATGSIV